MRILIVEDDADTRAFVAQGLGQAGHQVAVSADGRDGLFQATGGGFDAIVVDRMLPGLDGLALVRALRAAGDATPAVRQYLCGDTAATEPATGAWSSAPRPAHVQRQQA